jgi:hypothetical protein
MVMFLRIHETAKGKVVAVCDEELIGRVLDDGKAYMDLDRYRAFYVGDKAGRKQVLDALRSFSSANMVGKESVSVALSAKVAADDDIMYIKNKPYIQIYNI